jgi:hypothetical protein
VRLAKRHAPLVGERLIDELREALAAQTVTDRQRRPPDA